MAKITYENKEFLNKNENIADKNKVNDTDLNEIKAIVNENDDEVGNLSDLNTTDKSSVVNAINEVYGKIKFKSLLDTPVQAPNSTENYNWGTLNDDYTNYDVLLVRVASQSNGGEGTIGVLMPNVNSSTRIHLYAMEVYQAYVLVGTQNNNQIGLHAITVRGWNANSLYITSVYGIKF